MIALLFEIRALYLDTLEPEHDFIMKWISHTEKRKSWFLWNTWNWFANTITNEILMKTWYILVVLAVISVFAVCCFNTIRTSFLRKPFSRRNNNFRCFFAFLQNIGWSGIRSIPEAFTSIWTSKPNPLGIPRPISNWDTRISYEKTLRNSESEYSFLI